MSRIRFAASRSFHAAMYVWMLARTRASIIGRSIRFGGPARQCGRRPIRVANEHFSRLRRQTMSTPQRPAKGASVRVGRNEPCPCGSGKKHERCCLDGRAGAETSARDP
jgi:hypothetical protein